MMTILLILPLTLALVPALLFRANLRLYLPPPDSTAVPTVMPMSVLIPARNEEAAIGTAVKSALGSQDVDLEVIVLDDHSEDRTGAIVEELAAADPRVRLVSAPELPPGWCGKQHACHCLAQLARNPLLVFLDADVQLAPDALARMAAFLEISKSDLASGIPHQQTVGLMEKLLIPLIHFILLGFLPIARMRRSLLPSLSAGCGQLFIARSEAYHSMGGHAAIRGSLHDGIKLPRQFRAAGFKTDLFDATELASCRMYRNARDLWFGLAKNAGEALAAPSMIVPMTLILFCGQVLPVILLAQFWASGPQSPSSGQWILTLLAVAAAYYPRLAAVKHFRQPLLGAILHPVGIMILLAIQWYAWTCRVLGRPSTWKGRSYPKSSAGDRMPESLELESAAKAGSTIN